MGLIERLLCAFVEYPVELVRIECGPVKLVSLDGTIEINERLTKTT